MKKTISIMTTLLLLSLFAAPSAFSLWGNKAKNLTPQNGVVKIPTKDISDGKAHYFKVKAKDDIEVTFFTLMSTDGVIRAAVDSCDVCYRSGKGYIQEGDFMVCTNCGRKFAASRINEVKGGCNPAPLERNIIGADLVISMAVINQNSWYCKFK